MTSHHHGFQGHCQNIPSEPISHFKSSQKHGGHISTIRIHDDFPLKFTKKPRHFQWKSLGTQDWWIAPGPHFAPALNPIADPILHSDKHHLVKNMLVGPEHTQKSLVLIFGFSHRGVESPKSEYLMGSPVHYEHVLRRVVRNLWTENVSAFELPISKPHAKGRNSTLWNEQIVWIKVCYNV